ncbi:hypothetical protein BSKO_09235 [Bryopsis sp. KO-2023]|nr:hypothetical protein BSKO_09235 [Bryopsis sp. KO-2023]
MDISDQREYGAVVETFVKRSRRTVAALEKALTNGNPAENLPPLPSDVVLKILDSAEYWCCVEKRCESSIRGQNMNFRIFRFGPIPGQPKRIELRVESHDQGWSSYPHDHGTKRGSFTWGEVDVIDGNGRSKLGGRPRVFTNIHADSDWQIHDVSFDHDQGFMRVLGQGDSVELCLRSMCPLWEIFVRSARMALYFQQ